MHINWVTTGGPHLVSYRGRILTPAKYFESQGWTVTIGPHVPADVHVFSKHFNKAADLKAIAESPFGVFDLCDDHFQGPHGDYYRGMVKSAALVITSSQGLTEIAGRGIPIAEPWELPEGKVRTPRKKRALWYGHSANLYTLEPLLPYLRDWEVRVISNHAGAIPFSLENMRKGLEWCHVVLLPQPKAWKSPNRMVEAFRAGRFPVLADIPAYQGYGIPTGNELDTLKTVFDRNWTEELTAAQRRINREFAPEEIGKQWYLAITQALDCTSAAARSEWRATSTSTASNPLLM
jgi:hypothetical protein